MLNTSLFLFWTFRLFLFKDRLQVESLRWWSRSWRNCCWGRWGGTAALMSGTAALLMFSRWVLPLSMEYVSGNLCSNSLGILIISGLIFLWPNVAYSHLLDCLTWWILLPYNTWINLLHLRAIRFIKYHIYHDFNSTHGFVEDTIGMLIWSITKKNAFINFRCEFRGFGSFVKYKTLAPKHSKVWHLWFVTG